MFRKKFYIISALLVMVSCAKPSTQYPGLTPAEIAAERKVQQQIVDKNKNNNQVSYNNTNFQNRLNQTAPRVFKAGQELCKELGRTNNGCIYNVELQESEAINAYADGKKIVITTEMMKFTKDNDELALVLAHEYAHNMMGHIAARQQNVGLGAIFGAVLDSFAQSQGINTNGALSDIGTYAGATRYSQGFEKEADYVGLYISKRAGFNIENSPEFWRRMSIKNQKAIYTATTHPTNPERYVGLAKTIREIKQKKSNNRPLIPNIKTK